MGRRCIICGRRGFNRPTTWGTGYVSLRRVLSEQCHLELIVFAKSPNNRLLMKALPEWLFKYLSNSFANSIELKFAVHTISQSFLPWVVAVSPSKCSASLMSGSRSVKPTYVFFLDGLNRIYTKAIPDSNTQFRRS